MLLIAVCCSLFQNVAWIFIVPITVQACNCKSAVKVDFYKLAWSDRANKTHKAPQIQHKTLTVLITVLKRLLEFSPTLVSLMLTILTVILCCCYTEVLVQSDACMFEVHYSRAVSIATQVCNGSNVVKIVWGLHALTEKNGKNAFLEMSMFSPTLLIECAEVGNNVIQLANCHLKGIMNATCPKLAPWVLLVRGWALHITQSWC